MQSDNGHYAASEISQLDVLQEKGFPDPLPNKVARKHRAPLLRLVLRLNLRCDHARYAHLALPRQPRPCDHIYGLSVAIVHVNQRRLMPGARDIVKCCGWWRAHPDGLSGGFDVSVLKFNALEDEFNEFVTV